MYAYCDDNNNNNSIVVVVIEIRIAPIGIVFNAVEDYVDFAKLGQQPLTQRQTITKAYVILNKTRRFKNDITEWNRKPEIQKTWINFKAHFR
jgi:hypothetical protein